MSDRIVFESVSKFYGEVLGVNNVTLALAPGITSLVGPNGSGKSTLMNLMAGLIPPTRGRVEVLGFSPQRPEAMFRVIGYCTQYDSFPRRVTGHEFIYGWLRLHGLDHRQCMALTAEALERVRLTEAAHRPIAGYSKGMRQRIRLAQAISHHPTVLILDEPLNGLDPMARAESIALFQELGHEGMHVIISSHILEEVDRISDQVVLMSHGYVVAEGDIRGVRSEVKDHPIQVLVRCTNPAALAARVFGQTDVVEAQLHEDGAGVLVRTRDADSFYLLLNRIAREGLVDIEAVAPADDDVNSIYQYLIGSAGAS